jgi:steroid delta-isomerase-like uncharacterized protein
MKVEENLKVIESVDEAFNNRDWAAFSERHTENVVSHSPTHAEPTKGIKAHRESLQGLLDAFPDFQMKRVRSFGQGDWVCATYMFTGTHKGPLKGPGGKTIPPTNKSIRIEFASALKFENGKIAEEHIYYDRLEMLAQLGIIQ